MRSTLVIVHKTFYRKWLEDEVYIGDIVHKTFYRKWLEDEVYIGDLVHKTFYRKWLEDEVYIGDIVYKLAFQCNPQEHNLNNIISLWRFLWMLQIISRATFISVSLFIFL